MGAWGPARKRFAFAATIVAACSFALAHAHTGNAATYVTCGYGVSVGGPVTCLDLQQAVTNAIASPGPDTIEMNPGSYCPIDIEQNANGGIAFVGLGLGGLATNGQPLSISGSEAELTAIRYDSTFCGSTPPSALVTINSFLNSGSFTFRNLTFDGSAADGPSNGLDAGNSEDTVLRDIVVENMRGIGVRYQSGSSGFHDYSLQMNGSAVLNNNVGVDVIGFGSLDSSSFYGNQLAVSVTGETSLLEDTIAGNVEGVDAPCCGNSLQVWNTIVAGNTQDCHSTADWESGSLGSASNVLGPDCPARGTNDQSVVAVTFDAPGLNGGPTPSLLAPAAAQFQGTPNLCSPDQREYTAPPGGACLVGAVQPSANGTASLNASDVAFGDVDDDVTSDAGVTLSIDASQVDVTGVSIAGAGYSIPAQSNTCTDAVLVPAQGFGSCGVEIALTPTTTGEWDGTLTIETTAGTKTVQLTANSVDRPQGTDDSYTLTGGTLTVSAPGVLTNDDSAATFGQVVQQPSNGALVGPNADGSFSYSPNPGYTGTDSFQYTIENSGGVESHPITVTLTVTSPASSGTIYVNGDWAGTEPGDDPDGEGPATTFGVDSFATIRDALANAAAFESIDVAAGTYDESSDTLGIDQQGVTLESDGSGPVQVDVTTLDIDAAHVTVDGLDLHGDGTYNASATTFAGPHDPVVRFETDATDSTLSDCTIHDGWLGVLAAGGRQETEDEETADDDYTIADNEILHVGAGIELDSVFGSAISGNSIHDTGAVVHGGGTSEEAIYVDFGSEDDSVVGNTLDTVGGPGINVAGTGVTVTGNTITGAGALYPQFKEPAAIEVVEATDTSVSDNVIAQSQYTGVKVDGSSGTEITGNTISGSLHGGANGPIDTGAGGSGILITADGDQDTTIDGNTIQDNDGWGIFQSDAGSDTSGTTVNQNDIEDNTLGGVIDNDSNATVDATGNWWNDASGPSGDGPGTGDAVANASFDPWLQCATEDEPCATTNAPPAAAFVSTPTGLAIAFDGSGSSDSDGTVASYGWDFGDGQTGTGSTPSHTYASAGTYTVRLTVVDNEGGTGSVSHDVTVSAPVGGNLPPNASFSSSASGLQVSVDGSGSSDSEGPIAGYAWTFGDGGTATGATTSHTYASAGTYTVTLTVTDSGGATASISHDVTVAAGGSSNQAPTAAFTSGASGPGVSVDGSGSTDSDGAIASYSWAFGDGATATGVTASHTYASSGTYTLTLTVTDNGGATASVSHSVTVAGGNQAPTAAFTATPSGLAVTLDGTASSDADGTIASYAWSFGDGGSAAGATASHTYASAGTFAVTLTVTDDSGATASVSRSVTVSAPAPPAPNHAPTASFTSSTNGVQARFDGSASSDSDGTVASYAWDFGDGTTGSGATATHRYATPGTYAVTLTVTDDKGATGSSAAAVAVTATAAGWPTTVSLQSNIFDEPEFVSVGGQQLISYWFAALTLTATVSPAPDGGTVTYLYSGGSPACTGAVGPGGTVAPCPLQFITGGVVGFSASFSGSPNYAASKSGPVTVALKQPTTVTVTASDPYPAAGRQITYTAKVAQSPSGPVSDGTVSFTRDGAAIAGCTAVSVGSGGGATCTQTLADADVGVKTIGADYSGSSSLNSSSGTVPITVTKSAQGTSVTIFLDGPPVEYNTDPLRVVVSPVPSGGTVAFTATLPATATRPVTTTTLCASVPVDAAGTAQCPYYNPGEGNVTFTASYSGAPGFTPSTRVDEFHFESGAVETTHWSIAASSPAAATGKPVAYTASAYALDQVGVLNIFNGKDVGTVTFTDNGTPIPTCTALPVPWTIDTDYPHTQQDPATGDFPAIVVASVDCPVTYAKPGTHSVAIQYIGAYAGIAYSHPSVSGAMDEYYADGSSPAANVTVTETPSLQLPKQAAAPAQNLPASMLGTPKSATTTGRSTTIRQTNGPATATVSVPAGALPVGTTVSVYPVQSAGASVIVPRTSSYVAAFDVAWQTTDGTSPTAAKAITMTIVDPKIKAGDTIYQPTGNGRVKVVGKATEDGRATITFTTDPLFVIGSAPVAKLVTANGAVVGLACVSGGCVGAVRVTDGHGTLFGTGTYAVEHGARTLVRLKLTPAGRRARHSHAAETVVITVRDGAQISKTIRA